MYPHDCKEGKKRYYSLILEDPPLALYKKIKKIIIKKSFLHKFWWEKNDFASKVCVKYTSGPWKCDLTGCVRFVLIVLLLFGTHQITAFSGGTCRLCISY